MLYYCYFVIRYHRQSLYSPVLSQQKPMYHMLVSPSNWTLDQLKLLPVIVVSINLMVSLVPNLHSIYKTSIYQQKRLVLRKANILVYSSAT